MISLITPAKAQRLIAENLRLLRLKMNLTQAGLAQRSGVALPTLRKFEQKGVISLESYLKLQMVLGNLENIVKATVPAPKPYNSIDEVIAANKKSTNKHTRKRGRRK